MGLETAMRRTGRGALRAGAEVDVKVAFLMTGAIGFLVPIEGAAAAVLGRDTAPEDDG